MNLFWLGTPVDINVDVTKYFHRIRIFRFNLYYLAKKCFKNFGKALSHDLQIPT